mgnify:CR=1 FL=1
MTAADELPLAAGVLAVYLSQRVRTRPVGLETMANFLPLATVLQTLPQTAAVLLRLGLQSWKQNNHRSATGVSLLALGSAGLLELLRSELAARNEFAAVLRASGVRDADGVGAMDPARWAGFLLAVLPALRAGALRVLPSLPGGMRCATFRYHSERRENLIDVICSPAVVGRAVASGRALRCFLYIHGGGWRVGHRQLHSLPLQLAMADAGFVVRAERLHPPHTAVTSS